MDCLLTRLTIAEIKKTKQTMKNKLVVEKNAGVKRHGNVLLRITCVTEEMIVVRVRVN